MDEHKVVLVDPEDNVLGVMDKLEAHVGAGHLHRAVSVCLFDEAGRVLLQRRAWTKYHFRGRWSNSCCTHPMPGESPIRAAERRTREELGLGLRDAIGCGAFVYRAVDPESGLVEWELDHVVAALPDGSLALDPAETLEARWVPADLVPTVWDADEMTPWSARVIERACAGWGWRLAPQH